MPYHKLDEFMLRMRIERAIESSSIVQIGAGPFLGEGLYFWSIYAYDNHILSQIFLCYWQAEPTATKLMS